MIFYLQLKYQKTIFKLQINFKSQLEEGWVRSNKKLFVQTLIQLFVELMSF